MKIFDEILSLKIDLAFCFVNNKYLSLSKYLLKGLRILSEECSILKNNQKFLFSSMTTGLPVRNSLMALSIKVP
jgi:hypothetical protein